MSWLRDQKLGRGATQSRLPAQEAAESRSGGRWALFAAPEASAPGALGRGFLLNQVHGPSLRRLPPAPDGAPAGGLPAGPRAGGWKSRPAPPRDATIGRDRAGGPCSVRSAARLRSGPDLAAPGPGAAPAGCPAGWGWAGRGQDLALLRRSLSHRVPRSHAGRAPTLPPSARLPGAMDVALPGSLLEANCSLALAEELLWALPQDPEGRREASGARRRRLFLGHAGCA